MDDSMTTRDRILSLAKAHLTRGGYHSFSFADIANALNIKPAAVHYYFPSKVDLVIAVVRAYGDRFDAWSATVSNLQPVERLMAYWEVGRLFAVDGRVCPLSLVIAQREAVPASVVEAVVVVQQRILRFYVQTLCEAQASGAARFEGAAEEIGALVASSVIGAQLLARVCGPAAYQGVIRQQASLIGISDPWPKHTHNSQSPL